MKEITRAVIADLWPKYVSGECSPDTKRLVETYLTEDPDFVRTQGRNAEGIVATCPSAQDREGGTLSRVGRRLSSPAGLLQFAIIFSCLAFGRIVSDTSWDVSPRKFIATAVVAGCFWIAFFVRLLRGPRAVLLRLR